MTTAPIPVTGSHDTASTRVRTAAIIYNPERVALARLRRSVERAAIVAGWGESLWIPTTDGGPADALVAEAIDGGADVVVAAGGDGTVSSVGAAMRGTGVPFAIIPSGTANLLARNLGLPLVNMPAAARIAFRGTDRPIDVGHVEYRGEGGVAGASHYFVMAGFGVDADMVANTSPEGKQRFGWLAYVLPIFRSLGRRSVDDIDYSLDGGAGVRARVHSFIVGNAGTITAGLRMLPEAVMDDGLFDVLAIRSITGRDRNRLVRWLAPYNNPAGRKSRDRRGFRFPRSPANRPGGAFHYETAREVTVSMTAPVTIQADGDLLAPVTWARFRIEPGAVTVRVGA